MSSGITNPAEITNQEKQETNNYHAILRGLFVYNINNGGIVTEKYDKFICHARPPDVDSEHDRKKL